MKKISNRIIIQIFNRLKYSYGNYQQDPDMQSKIKKFPNSIIFWKFIFVSILDEPRVVIDLEYERQQQSYKMNDAVKSFITHFFRAIQNAKIFEITHDYEYG